MCLCVLICMHETTTMLSHWKVSSMLVSQEYYKSQAHLSSPLEELPQVIQKNISKISLIQEKTKSQHEVPVCNCISFWPRELDNVVKDPHLEASLYSATCNNIDECLSSIEVIVVADSIRICIKGRTVSKTCRIKIKNQNIRRWELNNQCIASVKKELSMHYEHDGTPNVVVMQAFEWRHLLWHYNIAILKKENWAQLSGKLLTLQDKNGNYNLV